MVSDVLRDPATALPHLRAQFAEVPAATDSLIAAAAESRGHLRLVLRGRRDSPCRCGLIGTEGCQHPDCEQVVPRGQPSVRWDPPARSGSVVCLACARHRWTEDA